MRPVAISVDAPEVSAKLARQAGYTFPILSDREGAAMQAYDLVHKGAGINGADVARPAEFLVDRTGTVRWRNLTEDYRVRARPEEVLEQARVIAPPPRSSASR